MTIPWLVGLPLVMAVVMLLARQFRLVTTPLTAATFIALAIALVTTDLPVPLILLGRSFRLTPLAAVMLALDSALLGLAALYGHRVGQGSPANALALGAFSLLAMAVSAQNFTLAVLLLDGAGILIVLLLAAYRADAAWIALRALFLLTLAGALLLGGAWALQYEALAPGNEGLVYMGALAATLGAAMILAAAPFHVWLPPSLASGSATSSIALAVALSSVVMVRLGDLQTKGAWGVGGVSTASLYTLLGVASIAVGSIGAWAQRSVGRILGYAALAETGLILVAFGLGDTQGMAAAFMHVIHRGLAIAAMSMVVGLLYHELGGDTVDDLVGALRRVPLTTIALGLGGMALADLPPTGGFLSRLAISKLLALQSPTLAIAVQLAAIGPAWALFRCLIATLRPVTAIAPRHRPIVSQAIPLIIGLGLLVLGLYPQALSWLPVVWQGLF